MYTVTLIDEGTYFSCKGGRDLSHGKRAESTRCEIKLTAV